MDLSLHYRDKVIGNKQWNFEDERALKQAKMLKWAGQVMATIFWNLCGIININ